tara:strand:+ start:4896 stop:5765 length:870 start_codon:yes stop_codon:yes gene_type:complete
LPELPEVETVRKGLEQKVSNFDIKKINVLKERSIASRGGSKVFVSEIEGLQISQWKRRGKYLIASLHGKKSANLKESFYHSGWLIVHLRMTGQFQLLKKKCPPCKHTRVRIWNKKGDELRFVDIRNFGQMWWIDSTERPERLIKGLGNLGPEPFSSQFNATYLKKKLNNRVRSIKSSLLDQSLIAGIGNIYADESLFAAKILPTRKSNEISEEELEKLCNCIIKILTLSIGKGGTTFSDFRDLKGLNGNYGSESLVYQRTNQPCKTCGAKIKKLKLSGRGTHWCPKCQK